MRNLKKILALVLALVMSLSLMATASAADAAATSSETVTPAYEIALQVLGKDGLKVFGGYTDGTIRPQNNITRAEVAAILYRIVTGDVTDAQAGIYTDMANVNFNDLTGANWAKGYINYCANAQLIVGVGGNQFKPLANITGYATLAMILRALGYDKNGEFKGSGWEIRTASKARELGILRNVSENQLGSSATRELVAELLFRAMLCDKVTYNALTQDYDKTGVTLGYEVFSLEEVEGVVVANEYADLRRDANGKGTNKTAADDTTVLRDAAGKDRIVTVASGLEDLGETRVAYTIENGKRNQYDLKNVKLENPGKDTITYDGGEEFTKAQVNAKIVGNEAEHYINFGEDFTKATTTIKVTYQAKKIVDTISALNTEKAVDAFLSKYHLDGTNNVVRTGYTEAMTLRAYLTANTKFDSYMGSGAYIITYEPEVGDIAAAGYVEGDHTFTVDKIGTETYYRVQIKPGAAFTSFDVAMVTDIFNFADLWNISATTTRIIDGEVYRGTQSVYDYSDWRSYESFREDCIKESVEDTNVGANGKGWWLKIIDNDNDGVTDWVFQTRYTVASVASVKDGVPTLDVTTTCGDDGVNAKSKITDGTINEGDEVVANDVVLYAVLDGKARVWKAEYVDARVNSINRSNLTVTVDGDTTYEESANHEHSARTDIQSGVVNMSGTTSSRLYLDKYGYMAAFSQNINGNFVLLTNGWFQNLKNGVEYAVTAWDSESQSLKQYDVTSGGNLFVDSGVYDGAHSWNRILPFPNVNCGPVSHADTADDLHTIVAYMETDGDNATLVPVDTIYDVEDQNDRGYYMIDMGKTIPTSALDTTHGKLQETTALARQPYNRTGAVAPVRALSDTIYYYVYHSYNTNGDAVYVHQITGYENGARWLNDDAAEHIEDVYVVGRQSIERTVDGTVDRTFYTANVVVVELDDDFFHTHYDVEEVFIYDFPVVGTWGTIEEVRAIREDGTNDEHLKIDLTASRTYTEVEDENNVFTPGLYYLHRTARTDSEGIYAISRMSHSEIRSSNRYDVGVVITSNFTLPSNYVEVRDYICTTAGAIGDGHNRPAVIPSANINATRKHVEGSDYYNLSYTAWTGTRGGYTGTATATANSDCLRQYWANDNTTDYNQNQVLVRYNTLGEIVYAISFAHTDSAGENYAQQVWRSVTLDRAKPDAATRYIEISKEAAQVLAEGDTVKLTKAVAKITVDGKEMTKDTVNDKFYITVNRASSYAIEVTMAAGYESCVLTGSDKIANVTLTGSNPYTLTFLEGNTAKDIRLQIAEDSIKPVDPALVEAVEAAEKALTDLASMSETVQKDEKVVAAKAALEDALKAEDATAASINAAVKALNDAIAAVDEDPGENVVNASDITVTAPTVKMGDTLPTTVTVAPADKVEVSAVVWKNEAGETVTKAETAGKYTATVTVTAKEGYTLAGGVASIDKTVDVTVEDTTGMVTVTITYVYEDVEMDTQEISVKPSEGKLTLETAKLTTPKIPTTGGLAETKVTAMDNGFTEDAEGNWTLTAETFADMAVKATVVKKDTTPGGGQEWGDLRIAGRPQVLTETEVTATKTIKGTITVESNTTLRELEQKDQGVFRYTPDTLKVIWNSLERVNDTTWIILATVPADTDNKTVYVEFCPGQMTEDDIALADAKAPALEALRTALKTGEGMPEGFKDLPAEKQAELLDAARENIQNAKTADEVTEAVKENTTNIEDAISGKTPTTVTLDKTTAELKVGEKVTLTATVTAEEGVDKAVTWTSSDEAVATVEDGTVTAVAEGTATITAAVGEAKATCTVTVTAASDLTPFEQAQEDAKAELDAYAVEAKAFIDANEDLTDDEKTEAKAAVDTALDNAKKAVDAVTEDEGEAVIDVEVQLGKTAMDAESGDTVANAKTEANKALDTAYTAAITAAKGNQTVISAVETAYANAKAAVTAATTKDAVAEAQTTGVANIEAAAKLLDAIEQGLKDVDRAVLVHNAKNPNMTDAQEAAVAAAKTAAEDAVRAAKSTGDIDDALAQLDKDLANAMDTSGAVKDPDTGAVTGINYYLGTATELSAEAFQAALDKANSGYKVPANYDPKSITGGVVSGVAVLDKDGNPVSITCTQVVKVTIDGVAYAEVPCATDSNAMEITGLTESAVYLTGDLLKATDGTDDSTKGDKWFAVSGGKISIANDKSLWNKDVDLLSTVTVTTSGTAIASAVKATKDANTKIGGSVAGTAITSGDHVKTGAALWIGEITAGAQNHWYNLKATDAKNAVLDNTTAQVTAADKKIAAATKAITVGAENITIAYTEGWLIEIAGTTISGIGEIDAQDSNNVKLTLANAPAAENFIVLTAGKAEVTGTNAAAAVKGAAHALATEKATYDKTTKVLTLLAAGVPATPENGTITLVPAVNVTFDSFAAGNTVTYTYDGIAYYDVEDDAEVKYATLDADGTEANIWIAAGAQITVTAEGKKVLSTIKTTEKFLDAGAKENTFVMTVSGSDAVALSLVSGTGSVAITATEVGSTKTDGQAKLYLSADTSIVKSITGTYSAAKIDAVEADADEGIEAVTGQDAIKDAALNGGMLIVPTDGTAARTVVAKLTLTAADGTFFTKTAEVTAPDDAEVQTLAGVSATPKFTYAVTDKVVVDESTITLTLTITIPEFTTD